MILWSTRYIVVSGTLEYTDSYGEAQRALRRGKGRPWDGRDGAREGRGRCAGPSSRFCWSHEISKLEGATSQLAHSAWPLGERGNCWMPMSSRRMTGHQHWPAVTSQIKPDQARSSQWGQIHYQLQTAIFCLRLNPSISQQIYWANLGRKTNGYCTLSYTKGRLFHEKLPVWIPINPL